MKLPDFLEELNQVAGIAVGEKAQAMIESRLHVKLPPKHERSVNMVRLRNATYDEMVTHLKCELYLNGLEERDDILVPTMTTALNHHVRVVASSLRELMPFLPATTAKSRLGMSNTSAENLREKKRPSAMKGRLPKKNTPNAHLATSEPPR